MGKGGGGRGGKGRKGARSPPTRRRDERRDRGRDGGRDRGDERRLKPVIKPNLASSSGKGSRRESEGKGSRRESEGKGGSRRDRSRSRDNRRDGRRDDVRIKREDEEKRKLGTFHVFNQNPISRRTPPRRDRNEPASSSIRPVAKSPRGRRGDIKPVRRDIGRRERSPRPRSRKRGRDEKGRGRGGARRVGSSPVKDRQGGSPGPRPPRGTREDDSKPLHIDLFNGTIFSKTYTEQDPMPDDCLIVLPSERDSITKAISWQSVFETAEPVSAQ